MIGETGIDHRQTDSLHAADEEYGLPADGAVCFLHVHYTSEQKQNGTEEHGEVDGRTEQGSGNCSKQNADSDECFSFVQWLFTLFRIE